MTGHLLPYKWIHIIVNEISECIQMVASYKMARVGIIVATTSLAIFCNCFVSGQHDPIRPKLSESFSAKVGVLIKLS